jgi:hypothetical protein
MSNFVASAMPNRYDINNALQCLQSPYSKVGLSHQTDSLRLERWITFPVDSFSRSGWPLPPFVLTFTTTPADVDALPASTAPANLPITSLQSGASFPTL